MSVTFVDTNANTNPQQNHSLQNIENYKSEFSCSSTEIFSKYIGILSEYFINCSETINIQNETYYKYVIIKGMETVAHVFRMLLLYTKNLSLTYYHCQKSFYYYVEFISQIGDNNHSFLQLNSRDASLFVYKKTIYEINQEIRKTFISTVQDNVIMNNIDILIHIYNRFLSEKLEMITGANSSTSANSSTCASANSSSTSSNSSKNASANNANASANANGNKEKDTETKKTKKCDIRLLSIDNEATRLAQIILNVSLNGDEKYFFEMLQLIKIFFDSSIWKHNEERMAVSANNNENDNNMKSSAEMKYAEMKYAYVDLFIKKIKKNTVTTEYLEKRLMNEENDTKFETLTPLRYINWLMSGVMLENTDV